MEVHKDGYEHEVGIRFVTVLLRWLVGAVVDSSRCVRFRFAASNLQTLIAAEQTIQQAVKSVVDWMWMWMWI